MARNFGWNDNFTLRHNELSIGVSVGAAGHTQVIQCEGFKEFSLSTARDFPNLSSCSEWWEGTRWWEMYNYL